MYQMKGALDKLSCVDLDNINIMDLSGVYQELAEQIGVENSYKVYQCLKGQQIVFPVGFLSKEYILSSMLSEYNGSNTRELAKKWGYTEGRVRQLIKQNTVK